MRIHLPALPHLDPVPANDFCAYTAKVRRFPALLERIGIQSLTYSGLPTGSLDIGGNVKVTSKAARARWFGRGTWPADRVFNAYEPTEKHWVEFNASCIAAIAKRIEPGDLVGIISGRSQEAIALAFGNDNPIVEWGVGYEGVLDWSFRAFESRAHQNYVAGWYKDDRGRFFDAVIPNSFEPAACITTMGVADSYLLFFGRQTATKGAEIVRLLAERGHRIVTAGQLDGGEPIPGTEYRGIVTGQEKALLLADAAAILVPSLYREPFGGVAIEAMLAGTPALTTPFGAFPETVIPNRTGYLCHTLTEFERAIERARGWSPGKREACAVSSAKRYTLDAVAPMYQTWLRRIESLIGHNWSEL